MSENEKLFESIDLTDAEPPNICSKCREHGLEHVPSGCVFVWCSHTETGCMRRFGGSWVIAEEIAALAFRRAVLGAILEGEQQYIDEQTGGLTSQ